MSTSVLHGDPLDPLKCAAAAVAALRAPSTKFLQHIGQGKARRGKARQDRARQGTGQSIEGRAMAQPVQVSKSNSIG